MKTKLRTERERVSPKAPGLSATGLTAGDVMRSPVITLDKDTPLREAARTLSENHIGGALVVDFGAAPLGVVSLFDIVSYLAGLDRPADEPGGFYRYSYPKFEEGGESWEREIEQAEDAPLREMPVAEIMSPRIISVPERLPIRQVARALWKHHIHRIFVSRNGAPVGVISTMDVLRVLSEGPEKGRSAGGGHAD